MLLVYVKLAGGSFSRNSATEQQRYFSFLHPSLGDWRGERQSRIVVRGDAWRLRANGAELEFFREL
jgi:hypothetical protein